MYVYSLSSTCMATWLVSIANSVDLLTDQLMHKEHCVAFDTINVANTVDTCTCTCTSTVYP